MQSSALWSMASNPRYYDLWTVYGDPGLSKFTLKCSPWSTLAMITAYLYFIKVLGPDFMPPRNPQYLRKSIVASNLAMVILSAWTFFEGCFLMNYCMDTWSSQGVNTSHTFTRDLKILSLGCLFLISRSLEFAETLVLNLRKRTAHVAAHIIHHALMPMLVFIGFMYVPGVSIAFLLIQSLVHAMMHAYYNLPTVGNFEFTEKELKENNFNVTDEPKSCAHHFKHDHNFEFSPESQRIYQDVLMGLKLLPRQTADQVLTECRSWNDQRGM